MAVRQGLQAKSFDLAAEAYGEAVGSGMSKDSLRRVTLDWGQAVEAQRVEQAQAVFGAQTTPGGCPGQALEEVDPIAEQANISTDGGMILLRQEGWKEVKLSVVSEVCLRPAAPASSPEPQTKLQRHSYQAGLWEADQMGQHQYLEGLRRGVGACPRLSSVNDGAPWIERITRSNYPQAVQIIDWSHADERLWKVAKAAFGEGTPQAAQWAETHGDQLWHGRVEDVIWALHDLNWNAITCPDEVRQSPTYFESRQQKMEYARFRLEGYPIGSGTVESGINTVVHHRMRRQGRGWERKHAQTMLAALSELHSRRFQRTWQSLLSLPN